MKIYDIDDKVILDVPVTKEAIHEQELSKSDYVKLSWLSDAKQVLPAGTYIVPFSDGLHYRLLEPYTPDQNNEIEWKYQPEFQHPLMWLSKIPFTYTTIDSSKKMSYTSQDWPYLGLTTSLLQVVVDQINALFGFTDDKDKFVFEIMGNVSATVNCTFSSTSILSALSTVANAASTDNSVEWHLSWEHKCLYFGQISVNLGEEVPVLEVGTNIGKVSVTSTKDGYYNVFFPQGSTRNISTRLTNGHYLVSSLRLGLNFPSGVSSVDAFANILSVESNKKGDNFFRITLDLQYLQTYFNEPLTKYGRDIYVVRLRIDDCTVNARVEGNKDGENTKIYSEYLKNATDPDDNSDLENFLQFQDKITVGKKVYIDGGVNTYNLPEENKELKSEKFDLQYPDGTIDIRTNKNEPKQVLALTFDDVYPHVDCYVYNVRCRTSILKKQNSNEDALDKDGNPIKYSIWYFRLAYPLSVQKEGCLLNSDGTPYTSVLDGTTYYWYDYYINSNKDIIDGYKAALQFKANSHDGAYAQPLLGQPTANSGFEVQCHQSNTTVKLDDGTTVKKGDYEITYVKQNDIIIPTTQADGLYPRGDSMPDFKANEAILYNIVMGANEIKAAQDELLQKTQKEIERRKQDLNNYSFSACPNIFEDEKKNPHLYIGQKVIFNDGASNVLTTRVIKLETKLDYSFEQSITVGNQKIKGTTSQLKEDVQTILSGNWSGGGGGLSYAQIDSLIKNYDDKAKTTFLRKDADDATEHKLTMGAAEVKGETKLDGGVSLGDGTYSISKEGVARLAGLVAEYLQSKDFKPGTGVGFDGTGFGLTKNTSGKYTMELDNLIVRMKMIIAELEVHEMTFIGGTVVLSPCGNRMDMVERYNAAGGKIAESDKTTAVEYYRCYFLASDGTQNVKNEWTAGQLARCKTNNITQPGNYKDYQNQDYWRLCVGVSSDPVTIAGRQYHYVDLSNSSSAQITLTDKSGVRHIVTIGGVSRTLNSTPAAGDKVIGLGHAWDAERQNCALLSVASDDMGWTLYKGITHYDLPSGCIVNKFSISETIVTTDHFILRPYAAPSEMQTVAVVRGAYDDKASYGHNDMVTCDGQTWIGSGIKIGETITGQKPAIDSPYWSLAASKGIQGDKGDGYSISFLLNNVPVDVINFDTVKGLESATLEADFFNNSVAVNVNKAVITCYDAEGNVLGSPIEATNAENIVVDGGNLYLSKNCQYITTAAYDADGKILVSKSIGVVRNGESVGVKDVTYKVINNVDANASLNWDAQTAQTAYPTQKPDKGKYCYVMTIVTYTDGSTTNSVSTSYTAKDGTSVTITDRKVEYAGADSGTTAPTTDWGTNVPQLEQGKYLWTRTTITYSDGIPVVSYSVGRIGMDGAKGGTTHILYASSANPRSESDVRTTIDAAHQYYGTYQDTELNDDPKKYTNVTSWVLIKGDQGHTPTITIGSNGNWYIDGTDSGQKAQGDAGHTPSVTIGADGYWYIDGVRTSQKAQGDSYSVVFKLNDVRVDVLNFDDVTEMESATFEADFFNQGVAVNVPKATMTCYDGEGNTLGSPIEIADASNIVADGGNLYLSKSCKTITVQLLDSNSQTLGSASLGVLRNTITYGLTKMNDTAATVKASDSTTNAAFKLHYNLHYKAVKMVGTVSRNVNIATITATIENADNTMTVNALEGALSGEGSVSYDADNHPASSIPVTVKLTDGTVLYDTVPVTMEAGVAVDINKNLGQIKQTVANNAGRISTVSQKADNISLKVSNMSRVLTVISHQLDNSAAASYVGTKSQRMISSTSRGFTYFFYLGDNTQVIHDTYGTPSECDTMAQELNGKRGAPGVLVILSYDATSMSQKLLDELEWWGLDPSMIGTWNSARIAFAFIGESNLGRGRGWWAKASGASGVATTQARISNGHVVPQYDGGDTAQKNVLLATGIDIESHKITATADNFMVRNNSGDQTFSIDRDGNIVGSGNASFRGKVYASGGEFTGTVTAAKIYGAYINGGSITGTTVTGSAITSTSADGKSVTKITGGQLTTGTTNKLIIDTPGNEPGGVLRITQDSDDVVKLGVTDTTGKAYADFKGAWKNETIARNVCAGPYLMLGQWVGQGHGEDRNTFSFLSKNFMYVKHIDAEFLEVGGMRMIPVTLTDIDFVHFRGLKDIDEEYMSFSGRSQYNHPSELYFWNSSEITFDLGDPAEYDDRGLVKNAGRILFIWQMGARIIFKGTPNPTSGNTAACMYLGRKIRGETSIDSDCLGQLNILMSDGKHWVMHYMND